MCSGKYFHIKSISLPLTIVEQQLCSSRSAGNQALYLITESWASELQYTGTSLDFIVVYVRDSCSVGLKSPNRNKSKLWTNKKRQFADLKKPERWHSGKPKNGTSANHKLLKK